MLVLKAPQSEVLAAVKRVAGVAPARSTLPIIGNLMVRKAGDVLSLTATDLEVQATITATLGGDAGDFEMTVSAKRLVDVLGTIPGDTIVSITEKAGKLTVQGGKSRFNLNTMHPADFPAMKPIVVQTQITLAQKALRGLIERVGFAMAVHDVRFYLNGVLFEIEPDGITAVATDGAQLAKASTGTGGATASVILPSLTANHLIKMLGDSDDPATVQIGDNVARFEFGSMVLLTKLIAGKFPDYRRLLGGNCPNTISIGRAPALQALRGAATMTTLKFKGVRVKVSPGTLTFSADSDGEHAEAGIDIDYDGPEIELGFDAKKLAEGLASASDEMVRLAFGAETQPLLMTLPNGDASYRYVLMPMRI